MIFNDLARRMSNDSDFYSFVIFGYSNIYPKYVDYFRESRTFSEMYNCKLRDGAWPLSSYHLIRSIVESYSTYMKNRHNYHRISEVAEERKTVNEEVNIFTDKEFVVGQFSLFDMVSGNVIDKEEYVLSSLDNLSAFAFSENGRVEFNRNFFPKYEDDLYAEELSRLLDSDTLSTLFRYAKDNEGNKSSLNSGLVDYKFWLDQDRALIMSKLKHNPALLDRVYSFLQLYNKCMRDSGMGTENGYSKRYKD